jgi:hypothetical protein
MEIWFIDFEEDQFVCASCQIKLQKPIFCLPANGKKGDNHA